MKGLTAGYSLLGSMLLATGLGYLVDRQFGVIPWGMLVGSMLGFGAGMYAIFKALSVPDDPNRPGN